MNTDIRCKDTHKLLARKDEQGLYLSCKECHENHFFSWQALGVTPIAEQASKKKQPAPRVLVATESL